MKTGPARLGISATAGAAIGAVIVIAVLAGVWLTSVPTNKETTANITSTYSTSAGISTVSVDSSTSVAASATSASTSGSVGPLAIVVGTTTIDKTSADAPPGYTTYIYNVTVADVGGADYLLSPAGFRAVSAANAVYNASSAQGVRQPLPLITLSPGQHASGQLSFQVPSGEQPVRLEYKNPSELVDVFVASLPQPSSWVSTIAFANATIRGAEQNDYLVFCTIPSSIPFYYSNDRTVVIITFQAFTSGATGIRVTSIAVSNQGFDIVGMSPALPVAVPSDGTKVSITLELSLPQTSVDVSVLNFAITTSQ